MFDVRIKGVVVRSRLGRYDAQVVSVVTLPHMSPGAAGPNPHRRQPGRRRRRSRNGVKGSEGATGGVNRRSAAAAGVLTATQRPLRVNRVQRVRVRWTDPIWQVSHPLAER